MNKSLNPGPDHRQITFADHPGKVVALDRLRLSVEFFDATPPVRMTLNSNQIGLRAGDHVTVGMSSDDLLTVGKGDTITFAQRLSN